MRRDDGFDHPSGKECLGPLKSKKHRPAVDPLLVLAPRVRLAENQTVKSIFFSAIFQKIAEMYKFTPRGEDCQP